jgi:6-phosphofructokinase 1
MEHVCRVVEERACVGKRFSIIVVSEGVKLPGGDYVVRQRVEGSHEQIRLGGVAVWLAHEIEERTGTESRAVVLGHIQRGGSPTAYDRVLGTRFGREAMTLAAAGRSDLMVGLHGQDISSVPLAEVAGRQRLVEPDCQILQTARSVGTSFGDE